MRQRQRSGLLLGGIVVIAGIARLATLDLQSFHHDEAVTVVKVLHPNLFDTVTAVVDKERSPPLYYVLAWAWSKVFGTGEVGLRSLSALLGTAVVPVAFLTARELASRRAGLFAAALVALNPYLIWYSQEARSYALMVLLTALALLFFVCAVRRQDGRFLAPWALGAALSLTAHYFAAFLIVPMAIWLIVTHPRRSRAVAAVAAVAVAGAALIPLAVAQEGDDRRNAFTQVPLIERVGEAGVDFFASEQPNLLEGDARVDAIQLTAAIVGVALLVIGVGIVARSEDPALRRGALLVGSVGAAGAAVPLVMAAAGIDFFNPRNLVGCVVPLLVVGALGLSSPTAGRAGTAAVAGASVVFFGVLAGVATSEQMQRANWRGAAETIEQRGGARVIVAPRNGDDPLQYYLEAERIPPGPPAPEVEIGRIDALATHFRDVKQPGGFRLVDQIRMEPLFMLWRYQSARPRTVRLEELAEQRVLSERSTVLLDE
jgi:mannosyltransferase